MKKTSEKKATTTKKASEKKASPKKSATKKAARKSTAAKKTETAEQTAAPAASASADREKPAKKSARKSTAKKADAKKAEGPKAEAKKADSKKSPPRKADTKQAGKDAPTEAADAGSDKKSGRKGITIVEPNKKAPSKGKSVSKHIPPVRPMLLGPGSSLSKPLIPSGPSAPKITSVFDAPKSRRTKSPFSKSKLDAFRALLIAKRAELLGDVESMENEALRSGSGGLSNTPQHLAEQGSESYDQSLSLNLAAQDRRLIKEIDDALARIEDGTYGLCELTNQPISEERLEELPWARYTIEAARQLESRGLRP
ncbi:MAG: TraR/DksA C4-type zinc finger protein [Phycisphaerales bacterium]|nr:TraR/DksA C4-type zinc finger protein [Planctomycetota bacterium]MCH8508229.1 TraR/DksA C4-type zinc finger protein [Phycisphaerales bacterium]